ncbi:hypothetical protein [Aquimarina sp. 2201CG14-23]|uniref:hypothetical protein n=1 Tax=Aquimarina mycalae TaxID=3040073 RepID=UPI0024782C64|nr:hypothetical protein [Aquimarina sp. 2201CG14-23]MDH7444870.1 hypothetical protein [Aquimarina sp. 2201CG14-23]
MKQFVFVISLFLILSCANNASMNKEAESVTSADVFLEEEFAPIAIEDAYAVLISEKLQDYLDTQILEKQHPEFKIKGGISELFTTKDAKEIQQVQFIGQPEIVSDSITKLKTLVRFANTKTDTIISYIKTSSTIIDGVKFKTSKTTFEKVKSSKTTH